MKSEDKKFYDAVFHCTGSCENGEVLNKMAKEMVKNYDEMIIKKRKKVELTRKRENIRKEHYITQDMVERVLDAAENEEMCRYLGITDWDDQPNHFASS
jgi:hypothetical protein